MTFAPKGGYQSPQNKSPKIDKNITKPPVNTREIVLAQMSRPVKRTSLYFFNLYKTLWRWSLLTLVLDFCLLALLPLVVAPFLTSESSSITEQLLIALILISTSYFIKNWTLSQITNWKTKRGKVFNFIERNPILIIIILLLLIAAEVVLKLGEINIVSVIAALVISFGAIQSLRKNINERIQKEKDLQKDLTIQVENFNQKLFLVHFIPLSAARLAVLISSLAFPLSIDHNPNFLLVICCGCIMLSLMRAEEQDFMISCRHCGIKTSRFLETYQACLACINNEKRASS